MDIDYSNYQRIVHYNLSQLKPEKWNFKSNDFYRTILEHVTFESGNEYLQLIQKEFSEIYNTNKDLFKALALKNDSLGSPIKYDYTFFGKISSTNLRYIYHSLIILSYMKKLNQNTYNIVEIGGGYGGLSFYIHNLSILFDINIQSYSIFDLDYISILQKEYLKEFNIHVNTFTLGEKFNIKENSFLISNYAFSELNNSIRLQYETNVIPYCNHGFLAWNFIPIYQFTKESYVYENEKPSTGNNNYFVYY